MLHIVWGFISHLLAYLALSGNNIHHFWRSHYLQINLLNKLEMEFGRNASKLRTVCLNWPVLHQDFLEKDDIFSWPYDFKTTHPILIKVWGREFTTKSGQTQKWHFELPTWIESNDLTKLALFPAPCATRHSAVSVWLATTKPRTVQQFILGSAKRSSIRTNPTSVISRDALDGTPIGCTEEGHHRNVVQHRRCHVLWTPPVCPTCFYHEALCQIPTSQSLLQHRWLRKTRWEGQQDDGLRCDSPPDAVG